MSSLTEIVGTRESVKIGEQAIDVYGVSLAGIAHLIHRFPELRAIIEGEPEKLTPDAVYGAAPNAVAAIIACGCGLIGDEKAEGIAANLPLETQYELLAAIGRATMPGGVGPFVDKLRELQSFAAAFTARDENPQVPETPSPNQSTISRELDTPTTT